MMWARYDRNASQRKAQSCRSAETGEYGLKDPKSLTILRANFPATA
jgi:hypothetical protein